jgi:uncharacterized glyoxalase superfamily protein PhnB
MGTEAQTNPVMVGVIPYINVEGAGVAADFYVKAFGAEETARIPAEDGKRFMHIALEINGGVLMMGDVFPEYGQAEQPPSGVTLTLVVHDIDAWWARAVDAGCTVVTPVQVMFWGDRFGALKDPFGVEWAMNSPVAKS